jgi:hypothetical protein
MRHRRVLCIVRVGEHTNGDVVDPRLMAPNEILDGAALACRRSFDQRPVCLVHGGVREPANYGS